MCTGTARFPTSCRTAANHEQGSARMASPDQRNGPARPRVEHRRSMLPPAPLLRSIVPILSAPDLLKNQYPSSKAGGPSADSDDRDTLCPARHTPAKLRWRPAAAPPVPDQRACGAKSRQQSTTNKGAVSEQCNASANKQLAYVPDLHAKE